MQVAGEQGGLVAAGAGADLDDQAGAVGAGLPVVEQVAERLADLGCWRSQSASSSASA